MMATKFEPQKCDFYSIDENGTHENKGIHRRSVTKFHPKTESCDAGL